MKTQPHDEHQWLKQLLGEWRFEGEAQMSSGQARCKSKGRLKTIRLTLSCMF